MKELVLNKAWNPATPGADTTAYRNEYYLVSFFGRLNYTLLDKYLLTATLRDDGSSRFSKDNRWGLFPAVAAAWKMTEESFIGKSDFLNELKLRLSWEKQDNRMLALIIIHIFRLTQQVIPALIINLEMHFILLFARMHMMQI